MAGLADVEAIGLWANRVEPGIAAAAICIKERRGMRFMSVSEQKMENK
jgi:hypothetical protein